MTHTKEPWFVEMSEAPLGCPFAWINAGHGDQYSGIAAITLVPAEANAARIVSCVNALAGLNPDAVADVVAALEECLNYVTNTEGELGIALDCGDRARTALARIRGEG